MRSNRIAKLSDEEEAARFAKLPKWAQSRIRILEERVESQKGRIDEISNQHPGTNVKVSGWVTYPGYDLPEDSQIEFTMGNEPAEPRKWRDKISVGHIRSDKGHNILRIQGDNSLIIRCSASNSFEVSFDDQ